MDSTQIFCTWSFSGNGLLDGPLSPHYLFSPLFPPSSLFGFPFELPRFFFRFLLFPPPPPHSLTFFSKPPSVVPSSSRFPAGSCLFPLFFTPPFELSFSPAEPKCIFGHGVVNNPPIYAYCICFTPPFLFTSLPFVLVPRRQTPPLPPKTSTWGTLPIGFFSAPPAFPGHLI